MFDLLIGLIIRILYWITQLYVILPVYGFLIRFHQFYGLKGPFGGLLIIVVGSLHLPYSLKYNGSI